MEGAFEFVSTIGLIDMHCDTLTDCNGVGPVNFLDDPKSAGAFQNPAGTKWAQCFAVLHPDELSGGAPRNFSGRADDFDRQMRILRPGQPVPPRRISAARCIQKIRGDPHG